MDSHKRSLLKTLTWRIAAMLITVMVAYILTRKVALAAAVGLGDAAIKMPAYYGHERIWEKIRFGRKASPDDYNI